MAATADELDVDSVIERLLGGKHEVQLPSDEGAAGGVARTPDRELPCAAAIVSPSCRHKPPSPSPLPPLSPLSLPPPLSVRGSQPGTLVQLAEAEIRGLCLKCRENAAGIGSPLQDLW